MWMKFTLRKNKDDVEGSFDFIWWNFEISAATKIQQRLRLTLFDRINKNRNISQSIPSLRLLEL